jgi:hypothetical protein
VERYGVYRDGAEIAELDGGETSYTDRQVVPGSVYWYEIESRAAGLVSDRAFSEVTVPLPPLRAARLAGVFNVRTKVESSSGYSDLSSASFGWRFRPRCGQGACDVRWSDLQTKTIRATLARRGTRYRGSYRGFFYVQCGSARAISAVELDVRVTAARVLGSEWRVTRFEGTVAQSEAEQLGCVASEARMSIRGRVAR